MAKTADPLSLIGADAKAGLNAIHLMMWNMIRSASTSESSPRQNG